MKKKLNHLKLYLPLPFVVAALCGIVVLPLHSAIVIAGSGTYSQSFDSLPSEGGSNTSYEWTDNGTLTGWYTDSALDGAYSSIKIGPHGSAGSFVGLYSLGYPANGSEDRALGVRQTSIDDNGHHVALGLAFQNQSDFAVTIDHMSYWGEQYWYTNTVARTNTTWYQISNDPITSPSAGSEEGWVALSELDLSSPAYLGNNPNPDLTTGPVDGNDSGYRTFVEADLSITLNPGEYIMFRFYDPDTFSQDPAFGYDDMTVTYTMVPEPSHFALLSGLLCIGLIVMRRR